MRVSRATFSAADTCVPEKRISRSVAISLCWSSCGYKCTATGKGEGTAVVGNWGEKGRDELHIRRHNKRGRRRFGIGGSEGYVLKEVPNYDEGRPGFLVCIYLKNLRRSSTSSLLPRKHGVRWWIEVGWTSSRRWSPVVARPPACSVRKATEKRDARVSYLVQRQNDARKRTREALVQQTELAVLRLLVTRVAEDATVQQCPEKHRMISDRSSLVGGEKRKHLCTSATMDPMYLNESKRVSGRHRRIAARSQEGCSPGAVRLAVRRVLDRLEVLDDRLVEEETVTLVERVDLATGRDLDVRVRQDELADALRNVEARQSVSFPESCPSRGGSRCRGCSR